MSREKRVVWEFDAWGEEAVPRAIGAAARIISRKYHQWVEKEDLVQVGWEWILTHPGKFKEYEDLGEPGRKKFMRALINAGTAYAQKEKAERSGYKVGDNHYYGMQWLKEKIPIVLEKGLDPDSEAYADWPLDTVSGRYDRAEWMDVVQAISKLTDAEYEILWRAFHGDPEDEQGYLNVAEFLGLEYDAARQRVQRVVRKVQESLGGPDPDAWKIRKRMANAKALYETRSQYEGEEG